METKYNISSARQIIMGEPHVLVTRNDGFRFYLDKVFLTYLENTDSADLPGLLEEFGVKAEEIPVIRKMLEGAGLLGAEGVELS